MVRFRDLSTADPQGMCFQTWQCLDTSRTSDYANLRICPCVPPSRVGSREGVVPAQFWVFLRLGVSYP